MTIAFNKCISKPANFLCVGLVLLLVGAVCASEKEETTAYKLSVIADVGHKERKSAEKRFEFVLPRMVEHCSDVDKEVRVADMLVAGYKFIKEAGLDSKEPLTDFTDTIHRITSDLHPLASAKDVPLKLSEVIGMYATLRQEGQTQEEARKGLTAVIRGIYNLLEDSDDEDDTESSDSPSQSDGDKNQRDRSKV